MAGEAFLGVTRSVTGQTWQSRSGDERQALAIAQVQQVPEIIGRLLAGRGLTPETAPGFLDPRVRDFLPDPNVFRDMPTAVARIVAAIKSDEQLAIFGDYDVDGATSAALLLRFFQAVGARKPLLYVPDRIKEGYGPNALALRKLHAAGCGLVVTVDCGITAFEALNDAAASGLDVIVIDHHIAEPALPKAIAVVNPNRLDQEAGYGALAAVGVTFMLIVALNRALRQEGWFGDGRAEPDLLNLLDLVALGTVCDVVPLTGLNRAFVAQGLKVMAQRRNIGLVALSDVAGLKERPGAYHAGFVLGPRVNAGGRVGQASLGALLLSADDALEAAAIAQRLDVYNAERRAVEAAVLAAVIDRIEAQSGPMHSVLMLAGDWHPGVIGIVASRLKERYRRPVCIGAASGGIVKGSGRSIAGFHLGNAIIAARESGLIAKGGGHAMAAGFECSEEQFIGLAQFLQERFDAQMHANTDLPQLYIDGTLQVRAATPDFAHLVSRLAPFGSGNPEPRFALADLRIATADIVGADHVRCQILGSDGGRLRAIAFRSVGTALGEALLKSGGLGVHLAGHLRVNQWQEREDIQFIVEDMAFVSG